MEYGNKFKRSANSIIDRRKIYENNLSNGKNFIQLC